MCCCSDLTPSHFRDGMEKGKGQGISGTGSNNSNCKDHGTKGGGGVRTCRSGEVSQSQNQSHTTKKKTNYTNTSGKNSIYSEFR